MDWKSCENSRYVKKASVDENFINSLLEASNDKYNIAKSIKVDSKAFSSIITLFYDSLREILEVIALKNGYKIYNHECYTSFLSEKLNEKEISERFDKARLIRNSINYYVRALNENEFNETKKDITELIDILKQRFVKKAK